MGNPTTTTHVPTSHFGGLRLPSGRAVRDCGDGEIRSELHRLNINGAHTDGLHIVLQRYQQLLANIWDAAGKKAVDEFLRARSID